MKPGVLQDVILGPLPFLIFAKDLQYGARLLDQKMYADDTNLFYSNWNIKKLFETANSELWNVNNWCFPNKLSLKSEKEKEKYKGKPLQNLTRKMKK